MTADIAQRWLSERDGLDLSQSRIDFIGWNSGLGTAAEPLRHEPPEIMMRFAARVKTRADAERITRLSEFLVVLGPLGMGERREFLNRCIGIYPTLIPRDVCNVQTELIEVA